MRPQVSSVVTTTGTAVGYSNILAMNYHADPFNVSLFVTVVSGSPTYTVQASASTIADPLYVLASDTWFNHSTLTSGTTTAVSNYAFPVTAVRIMSTGSGAVQLTAIQAGVL